MRLVAPVVGFIAIIGIVAGVLIWQHHDRGSSTNQGEGRTVPITNDTQSSDQLQSTDLVVGSGEMATKGQKVSVNYLGTLTNGTKFDSSYDRKQPFSFTLGAGEVIAGWDQGVAGMKVGGKRKLVIPPSLGYGSAGAGSTIPPNATLVFEIELLSVSQP